MNKEQLITIKVALIRALNSLDNEIADLSTDKGIGFSQRNAMRDILHRSRDDMTALYNQMDDMIGGAS